MGLISHLLHTHESLEPVRLSDTLGGLLLLSPWVTFAQEAPAMIKNEGKDVLEKLVLQRWSTSFLGKAEVDNYNTPLNAKPDWWQQMPVREICVLAGKDEIFRDDIELFVENLKVHVPSANLIDAF